MTSFSRDAKYSVQTRLDYIDWRLVVHGSIRREHLVEQFSIGSVLASRALTAFQRSHPRAIVYDYVARHYVPAKLPYRSQRGWTPAALRAMADLAKHHEMGWQ
jgi:hypothetical protein